MGDRVCENCHHYFALATVRNGSTRGKSQWRYSSRKTCSRRCELELISNKLKGNENNMAPISKGVLRIINDKTGKVYMEITEGSPEWQSFRHTIWTKPFLIPGFDGPFVGEITGLTVYCHKVEAANAV